MQSLYLLILMKKAHFCSQAVQHSALPKSAGGSKITRSLPEGQWWSGV